MEPIDRALKKIAAATTKQTKPSPKSEEPAMPKTLGDPNCPLCGGVGFLHQDLPVDDPNFGRLLVCTCRQQEISQTSYDRLYRLSNLEAFKGMKHGHGGRSIRKKDEAALGK
jgi:DNA replication protein DnaC